MVLFLFVVMQIVYLNKILKLKKNLFLFISILFLAVVGIICYCFFAPKKQQTAYKLSPKHTPTTASADAAIYAREKSFGQQIKSYISLKKYNTKYCVLVDMGQSSNQERLFLYDLVKDSIIKTGLVAHGTGSEKRDKDGNLVFSNVDGSLCTSLGRYKIGLPYKGIWGYAYRLIGLDSTNNNALKRAIVLHGHACVPDAAQTNNYPICFSYGCPMTSPSTLQFLRKYLDKPEKPVLLWIYK